MGWLEPKVYEESLWLRAVGGGLFQFIQSVVMMGRKITWFWKISENDCFSVISCKSLYARTEYPFLIKCGCQLLLKFISMSEKQWWRRFLLERGEWCGEVFGLVNLSCLCKQKNLVLIHSGRLQIYAPFYFLSFWYYLGSA